MKTAKAFLLGAIIAVLAIFSYQQHSRLKTLETAQDKLLDMVLEQSAQIAELSATQKAVQKFQTAP